MDPNLVLNESQRRARFSNVLKWPSRRNKLPPTENIGDQIQKRQVENATLSHIEAQTEDRVNGTNAGLATASAGPVPSTSAIQICVWDLIAQEENCDLTDKSRTVCGQKQEVNPSSIDSNESCTNLSQLNKQIFSYRASEAQLSCCLDIITNDNIITLHQQKLESMLVYISNIHYLTIDMSCFNSWNNTTNSTYRIYSFTCKTIIILLCSHI